MKHESKEKLNNCINIQGSYSLVLKNSGLFQDSENVFQDFGITQQCSKIDRQQYNPSRNGHHELKRNCSLKILNLKFVFQ